MRKTAYLAALVVLLSIAFGIAVIRNKYSYQDTTEHLPIIETDVFVFGASLGGTSAAITAAENGAQVMLVSESERVGGRSVEAGFSVFEESGRSWERYGLYRDLISYVSRKYGSGNVIGGAGDALSGSFSTIPSDIEEFLRMRMKRDNLMFFTSFELVEMRSQFGEFHEAVLRKNGAQDPAFIVRFRSAIDGTETGKMYPLANVGYRIGFDQRDTTHESLAFPKLVREAFVHGFGRGAETVGGFGNRVAAVSVPFVAIDRGYRGDFIPVNPPTTNCFLESATAPFIIGAKVWESKWPDCPLTTTLLPPARDVYDVYLINHGTRVIAELRLPTLPHPLYLRPNVSSGAMFVHLGAFPLDPESPGSLTLRSPSAGYDIEGIIIAKRNTSLEPAVIENPAQAMFDLDGHSNMIADLYLEANIWIPPRALQVIINGEQYEAKLIGPRTYHASDVAVRRTGNSFSLATPYAWSIDAAAIIPHSIAINNVMSFDDANAEDTIHVSLLKEDSLVRNEQAKREWDFASSLEGTYVLLGGEATVDSHVVELRDEDGLRIASSRSEHTFKPRGGMYPIFVTALEKNNYYRLAAGSPSNDALAAAHYQLARVDESNVQYGVGVGLATLQPKVEGMYDVWVKTKKNAMDVRIFSSAQSRIIPTSESSFAYAGRFFLDSDIGLIAHAKEQEGIELIALPNFETDVYELRMSADDLGKGQRITLPPGEWSFLARSTGALAGAFAVSASDSEYRMIRLSSVSQRATGSLIIGKEPVVLSGSFASSKEYVTMHFFEAPPAQLDQEFIVDNPLFSENGASFFRMMNVVSSDNMRQITALSHNNIGSNTLGAALIQTSSIEHAPILAEHIDDSEAYDAAKNLSKSFLYWLRYDAEDNFGCNTLDSVTCDPRRIVRDVQLLQTKDGFASIPLINEGRRRVAVEPLSQSDTTIAFRNCREEKCLVQECSRFVPGDKMCLMKQQQITAFADAIAASFTETNTPTYFSLAERHSGVQSRFLSIFHTRKLLAEYAAFLEGAPAAKPLSITLGSVIPEDGKNIYPGSLTFGMTQIARTNLRTNVTEMAFGQAIGHLLSYSIVNDINPASIYRWKRRRKRFQHYLVEHGMVLYPIDDMNDDDLLRKAVQHLIIDGDLVPRTEVRSVGDLRLLADTLANVSTEDYALTEQLFEDPKQNVTLRELISLFSPKEYGDALLVSHGKELSLLPERISTASGVGMLSESINKGHLFKSVRQRIGN